MIRRGMASGTKVVLGLILGGIGLGLFALRYRRLMPPTTRPATAPAGAVTTQPASAPADRAPDPGEQP